MNMVIDGPCGYKHQARKLSASARSSQSCHGKLYSAAYSVPETNLTVPAFCFITCSRTAPMPNAAASVVTGSLTCGLKSVNTDAEGSTSFCVSKAPFVIGFHWKG